jgi:hypothetical protein
MGPIRHPETCLKKQLTLRSDTERRRLLFFPQDGGRKETLFLSVKLNYVTPKNVLISVLSATRSLYIKLLKVTILLIYLSNS